MTGANRLNRGEVGLWINALHNAIGNAKQDATQVMHREASSRYMRKPARVLHAMRCSNADGKAHRRGVRAIEPGTLGDGSSSVPFAHPGAPQRSCRVDWPGLANAGTPGEF